VIEQEEHMNRYRLRIVLLSLGVLFGFGSAFAHFSHAREHGAHWGRHGPCQGYADEPAPTKSAQTL
jgi:hypothetical protein